jgi:hypothetical protein
LSCLLFFYLMLYLLTWWERFLQNKRKWFVFWAKLMN